MTNTARRFNTTLAMLTAVVLPAVALPAQTTARDTTEAREHLTLFTAGDAALAAGFVGLTIAMFPLDKSIAQRLSHDSVLYASRNSAAKDIEYIAVPGAYLIAPALYAYGRFGHHPVVEDVGLHTTEAVLLATGITEVLKGGLGRSRPYFSHDTLPNDFHWGKGFTGEDFASFPSAHTAVAFAAASSITSELAREWPGHTWFVAPISYGTATMVGLARMYTDKHWASDVVLGAGFGIFSGLKVVRYAHSNPDNYFDRMLLHTSIAPDVNGGARLSMTVPIP